MKPVQFAKLALVSALALGVAPANADPGNAAAAVAQEMIFDEPHLKTVKAPGELHYNHVVTITDKVNYGVGFEDTVRLDLTDPTPQTPDKDVVLYAYTGERARNPITFKNRTANPVILMFLEQDLWRMRQRVGGQAEYFKGRVAQALREKVQVEKITAKVDGREVPATRITFKPFENDPHAFRLKDFTTKTYEFTLSKEVPGEVIELRTTVFDPAKDSKEPVLEEKISYIRATTGS